MRNGAREGDPCPMCNRLLRSLRCGTCHGTGAIGFFFTHVCKNCGGFFAHPGLGTPTEGARQADMC